MMERAQRGHKKIASEPTKGRRSHDFFESWRLTTSGFSLEEKGAYAEICAFVTGAKEWLQDRDGPIILHVNARRWKRLKDKLVSSGALKEDEFGSVLPRALEGLSHKRGYQYKKDKIPQALRWEVYRRDRYACVRCSSEDNLTVDHVVPERRGGETVRENLQTLCRPCNSRKGAA